jgi:DNA uptake protein ComE-like DNA-binding protein
VASRGKKSISGADAWLLEGVPLPDRRRAEPETGAEPAPAVGRAAEKIGPETRQWLAIPPPPAGAAKLKRERANGNGLQSNGAAEKRETRRERELSSKLSSAQRLIDEQRDEVAQLQSRITELEAEAAKARKDAQKTRAPSKRSRARPRATAKLDKALKTIDEKDEKIAQLSQKVRELQADLRRHAKQTDEDLAESFEKHEVEIRAELAQRESKLVERIGTLESELESARKRTSARPARRTTSTAARKGANRSEAKAGRSKASARGNDPLDLNAATFEELRNLGLSVTQSARMIAYRDVRGGYKSLDELDGIPGLAEKTREELKAKLNLGD